MCTTRTYTWMQHFFDYHHSDDRGLTPADWLNELEKQYIIFNCLTTSTPRGTLVLAHVSKRGEDD